MWASAGATLGTNGNVYVSSGNGFQLDGVWDKSDSVTELTPDTLVLKSIFAPRTWRADNIADLDLGSMAPTMVPAVDRVVIAGKRGVVYPAPDAHARELRHRRARRVPRLRRRRSSRAPR